MHMKPSILINSVRPVIFYPKADTNNLVEGPEAVLRRLIITIARQTKMLLRRLGSGLVKSFGAIAMYLARGLARRHQAKTGLNKHFSETGYYIGYFIL